MQGLFFMKEVKVLRNRLMADRVRSVLMRSGIPCTIVQLKGIRIDGSGIANAHRDISKADKSIYITQYSVNVPDDLYEEGVWILRDMGTPLPLVEYIFPMVKKIRRTKYVRSHGGAGGDPSRNAALNSEEQGLYHMDGYIGGTPLGGSSSEGSSSEGSPSNDGGITNTPAAAAQREAQPAINP